MIRPTIDGAPGLRWRARANHWVAVWVCRGDIAKKKRPKGPDGESPDGSNTVRLWPPSENLTAELDEETATWIRSECIRLQNEMLDWSRGSVGAVQPFNGTLSSLIRTYQTDPESPYRTKRYSTRKSYTLNLGILNRKGDMLLRNITGRVLTRWYAELRAPKRMGDPERVTRAHGAMTMLRILLSYGVAFEIDKQCVRLKMILHELRFETPGARTAELTAGQVVAIRTLALAQGHRALALAQALQFELSLRQKDVIGEWVPVGEPGLSEVTHHGRKWLWGVRWEEVDANLILRHPTSKSNGRRVVEFDLKLCPMTMADLAQIPPEQRVGPLIKGEKTGRPPVGRVFYREWRKIARKVGVPDNVANMDSRAGATTETIEATGGDIEAARKQAGHSKASTTQRYSRGVLRSNSKVAVLRVAHRKDGA